jgi:nucleoside-diphosphate-sugar epimerase
VETVVNRYLVTGHSGFIGSHIVSELGREPCYIRGLTRQPHRPGSDNSVDVRVGDLTRPATLDGLMSNIDTVIHAAGYAHASDSDHDVHYRTTLEGTRHLLHEAVASNVRRFVFISSTKAMPAPHRDCIDETETGLPRDGYGLARRHTEEQVLKTGNRTGMHVSIVRPALVYGPGCKGNLAAMLRWIDRGIFPPVPDTGNRRSMVDVRDLARAVIAASRRASANGRTCIIADGEDYSTRRIYQAMKTALGKSTPRWSVPAGIYRAAGHAGDLYEAVLRRPAAFNSAVCSRLLDSACYHSVVAETALGFRPEFCLEDSLPMMVRHYRQQTPVIPTA